MPPSSSSRSGGTGDRRNEDVRLDGQGTEISVLPWPLLLRQRLTSKMESSSRYPWLVLGTTLFGLFTTGFTITILTVSLPSIAKELGSSASTLTWVITGPLLAFGIVGPTLGKAGDVWGHKRLYVLGLFGSALFAVGIALSWNATSLIAFRVLAAAAGAACGPASMALIYTVFPREQRVKAMGYWSMVMAGGPVLGVVAGGPIVEALSWRWIFVVQAPLTMFGALVAALLLPETARKAATKLDLTGAVLLGIGITSFLLALNRGPVLGWSSVVVLGAFLAAPVFLALFLWWEGRVEAPLLRLDYLRRRNIAAPIANLCFTNFAYMGGFIITPFLLADVFGYGQTRIGLLSIARPLAFALSAPLLGGLAVRIGERRAGMGGAVAIVVSMVLFSRLDPGISDLLVVAALALSGLGQGASSPSMAATVANAVDAEDLGIAGATQQLLSQVGTVAGIQLMQTFQAARAEEVGVVASYSGAYLLGGGVAVLGLIAASFVRSTRRSDVEEEDDADLEGVDALSGEREALAVSR